MQNRKRAPKLTRSESQYQTNSAGVVLQVRRRMYLKEILLASDYHLPFFVEAEKKQKGESKKKINCPTLIGDYNKINGRVDIIDQKIKSMI